MSADDVADNKEVAAEVSKTIDDAKSDESYDIVENVPAIGVDSEQAEEEIEPKKDPAKASAPPVNTPKKADPGKSLEDVGSPQEVDIPALGIDDDDLEEAEEEAGNAQIQIVRDEDLDASRADDRRSSDAGSETLPSEAPQVKIFHSRRDTADSKLSFVSDSSEPDLEAEEEAEVQKWLTTLDLQQFYPVFMQEGFDSMTRVNELTEKDLLAMGLQKGHRYIIMEALGKNSSSYGLGTYCIIERQGCLVRESESTTSRELQILPMDTVINVVEISDRRARIDKPITGWVSIISTRGNVIAERCESEPSFPKQRNSLISHPPSSINPNLPVERVDIILVGETATGKTSLMRCFEGTEFNEFEQSTLGLDFRWRQLALKDRSCKVWVWDTCGQEKLRSIAKNYYRRAQGVMFVCDIHSPRDVLSWVDEVKENTVDSTEFMLLLNKIDLADDQENCILKCSEIADECGIPSFYVTSAKTGEGVIQAFRTLTERIVANPALTRVTSSRLGGGRSRAYSSSSAPRQNCCNG